MYATQEWKDARGTPSWGVPSQKTDFSQHRYKKKLNKKGEYNEPHRGLKIFGRIRTNDAVIVSEGYKVTYSPYFHFILLHLFY